MSFKCVQSYNDWEVAALKEKAQIIKLN
jgi:hypothetical protein